MSLSSALQTAAVVLGLWMLVSIAATILLIPWLRAHAGANDASSRRDRAEHWEHAASAVSPGEIAAR